MPLSGTVAREMALGELTAPAARRTRMVDPPDRRLGLQGSPPILIFTGQIPVLAEKESAFTPRYSLPAVAVSVAIGAGSQPAARSVPSSSASSAAVVG